MTATLNTMATKKESAEESAELVAARELVRRAKEQGLSLTGPGGLLKQLTKTVLEAALNEELTEHLGHEHRAAATSGNVRNGTRTKTVLTESSGHVEIDVPRDRDVLRLACGPARLRVKDRGFRREGGAARAPLPLDVRMQRLIVLNGDTGSKLVRGAYVGESVLHTKCRGAIGAQNPPEHLLLCSFRMLRTTRKPRPLQQRLRKHPDAKCKGGRHHRMNGARIRAQNDLG